MSLILRAVPRLRVHILRLAALAGMAGSLAGCVTIPSQSAIRPTGTDGAVFFKITSNYALDFWQRPTAYAVVRRVPDATSPDHSCYFLRSNSRALSGGTFVAGALPTGTYEFPNLGAPDSTIAVGCDGHGPEALRFTIASGRITYLGNWVESKTWNRQQNSMVIVDDTERARLALTVPNAFPDLAPLLAKPTLGFVTPSSQRTQAASLKAALRGGFGATSPTLAAGNTWIYGTRTGGVRYWREEMGTAIALDTGYRVSIEATTELADHSWLVGGEQSTLLHSSDKGATWSLVDADLPYGVIIGLTSWQGDVIATMVDNADVAIYRSDASMRAWKRVATFKSEFAWFTGVPNIRPMAATSGHSVVVSLPSRRVGIYDMATGEAVARDLPGAIQLFGVSGDGSLHCKCAPVIVMNPYESHDLGKTWTSSKFSRYSTLPAMKDSKTGLVWTKDGIDRTRDGGATWSHAAQPTDHWVSLFYSPDSTRAFAADGATMWMSRDDGATWVKAYHTDVSPFSVPFE